MDAQTLEHNTGKRTRLWLVLGALAVLVLFAVWLVLSLAAGSGAERVEREHEIQLPASADNFQTLGDASNPILRVTNLDRGASSIFTLDRTEVGELLNELGVAGPEAFADDPWGMTGAPANAIYQPSSVPWSGREALETSGLTPTSAGDFTSIEIYDIDESTVGIWLYTDWN